MIAFAPIVDLPPPQPPPAQTSQGQGAIKIKENYKQNEIFTNSTECSYLLMFFVMGVIALSIKDMSSR